MTLLLLKGSLPLSTGIYRRGEQDTEVLSAVLQPQQHFKVSGPALLILLVLTFTSFIIMSYSGIHVDAVCFLRNFIVIYQLISGTLQLIKVLPRVLNIHYCLCSKCFNSMSAYQCLAIGVLG